MTAAAPVIAVAPSARRSRVATATLAGVLLTLLAADNILLLRFLGIPPGVVAVLVISGVGLITWLSRTALRSMPTVSINTVAVCFIAAFVLLVLGGEGRFIYANADWQIRDAVLADMAGHPWPFAYVFKGETLVLRAPLGMYLLPALAGPGAAAELALLASNTVRLGLCLALAAPLFHSARSRGVALACFLLFSGWDIVGTALYEALGVGVGWDHIENWNFGFQYSSHLTLLFWVPQHTIAGWLGAVTFLLWREGKAPIGLFAATVPLVALWSPLAVIGAVPFVIYAGVTVLRQRSFTVHDVALAAAALLISAAALAYLQLDAAKVGVRFTGATLPILIFCLLLEVLPFLFPLLRDADRNRQDRPLLLLVLSVLTILPLVQIGYSTDLQMRGAIMPFAILSFAFARWLGTTLVEQGRPAALACAVAIVLIGAATPALELRRAVVNAPSPPPLCSLADVYERQSSGIIVPTGTYFARITALPAVLLPIPVRVHEQRRSQCWSRPWQSRRSWPIGLTMGPA